MTAECKGLPLIVPLHDGDGYETEHYRISVCDSDHAAPGLCYRFEHKRTGHAAGFTGDTRYRPEFGGFFKGCDLLIHEASFGAGPLDPERNRICKHSSAQEAARVAQEAQVKRLLLTHAHCSHREAAVSAAQARLSIPWAGRNHGRCSRFEENRTLPPCRPAAGQTASQPVLLLIIPLSNLTGMLISRF